SLINVDIDNSVLAHIQGYHSPISLPSINKYVNCGNEADWCERYCYVL
ncbi:MAG: hypothetical protein ACJAY2_003222, partial [Pseudomonadales bacterium]